MKLRYFILFGSVIIFVSVFVMIFICVNFSFTKHNSENMRKHRVILIVLDAFRHDYLEIAKSRQIDLKNIQRMADNGARSMQVTPVFPSVTFPNHQALITGLYSPYHGITYNDFNDSSMNYDQFSMDNQSSLNEARWYQGYPDPIWVTCEKNAHCKSGSMLWPSTDASFNGYRPWRQVGQYIALNEEPNVIYPYDRRVDELIGWISNDLIDFGMIYFDEPDITSHNNGPLHPKTLAKLKEMDGYIGRLMDGLEKVDLLRYTDLILTSDHGMTEMSLERVINIDEYVAPELYKSTYSYPVGIIYPNEGKFDRVFSLYSNASAHIKVYKREDLPNDLFYKENTRRISPIVTVVDLGWFVNCSHYNKKFHKGYHGYSPHYTDMKATLIAIGPSFKKSVIPDSRHVDLYLLMSHLLGLKANPNNGSFDALSSLLTEDARKWIAIEDKWQYNTYVVVSFVMLLCQILLSMLFIIIILRHSLKHRDRSPNFVLTDKDSHLP